MSNFFIIVNLILFQYKITTKEPDDSMIEVAIEALKAVLTDNPDDDKW